MTDKTEKKPLKARRGDGGIYLVVSDGSEEFDLALRYAVRLSSLNRSRLAILHVIDESEFQQWGTVEDIMKAELRQQAEHKLSMVAAKVLELGGQNPCLYIREGERTNTLVDVINEDMGIRMLILGGGINPTGPGPLVSHFTGRGLGRLRVPVMIVPGNLEPQKIDAIT